MGTKMVRTELEDEGAHFFRSDFQVHSPRDPQWDGARPADEAEREKWASDFVAACRVIGLNAVAISDHHDLTYFSFVRKAAEFETDAENAVLDPRDRLVVFPALELTLSVPCQAILILDADFPGEKLDDVLKALNFEPVDPSLPVMPQAAELPDSADIASLASKLDKHAWLKGRYIILPNVTPRGHKTLLRTSFQTKYKDMPSVGGYLDGSVDKLGDKKYVGEKKILEGKDKAWGNKSLALFQTSDSRSADFNHLGVFSTWVKWSEPTAEALRQACLARESRIKHVMPAIPNVWISQVVVSQSTFMGRVEVNLNPQYTALIGGRGTGKSTILDYVRWALCDQPAEAGEEDEVANPRVRQRRLIVATLAAVDGRVDVHCVINGIPHIVRRQSKSGEVELKVGEGEFQKTRETVVRSLLPVQAYSQKQLSSVSVRLDELTRFVTAPIQRELQGIERELADVTGRLRENYGTLQRLRTLETEAERTEVRQRSLADQADAIRSALTGLSDDDRDILKLKPEYDDAATAVAEAAAHLETASSETNALLLKLQNEEAQFSGTAEGPAALDAQLREARNESRDAITKLQHEIQAALSSFEIGRGDNSNLLNATRAIEVSIAEFEVRYAAVTKRSTAHEAKLAELAALERQLAAASVLLQDQRRDMGKLGDPRASHLTLRGELDALTRRRSAALAAQCALLSTSSDGLIRATLAVGQNFIDALARFKGLVAGSNVRTAKIESMFDLLTKDADPLDTWEHALEELEALMVMEPDADIATDKTKTLSRLGLSVDDLKKIRPKLTPDGWLDLSLTPLTDTPRFEYETAESTYIPFSSASAGQQATALLTTLLSQDGMPLLVDQPEEDLDSDTIQKIVQKVWESKGRRQIIFASHNANLVVNGDADLVLVCAYASGGNQSAGQIKAKGAIDQKQIREAITAIMEGGETAFRLRKEKYGF